MSDLAVVVVCHQPYLKWLPTMLESVERQAPQPAERVLVLDGCGPPAPAVDGSWRCVQGSWGHPGGARNAGLAATQAPWVSFWDADNAMADGFVAAAQHAARTAPPEVAILYPDIDYCDQGLAPLRRWAVPPWDYWELRAENYIDTASAWRRQALEVVGGWLESTEALDDYELALRLTAAGWTAAKLDGPPVLMRGHPDQRHRAGPLPTSIWKARSLAVVSLLAGRDDTLARWTGFLLEAELAPRTALYVVDNSGRPEFTRRALDACERVAGARGLTHLDVASVGQAYAAAAQSWFVKARHLHVARLYASVLPRVGEDLVMTLEDDVEPPADAPRRLGEAIGFHSHGRVGVVAAAYAMAHHDDVVCAGWGADDGELWGPSPRWDQLPAAPVDVAFVGGGCSVWAGWAVGGSPVRLAWDRQLGWDAVLCQTLRRRGYRVRLHGGVRGRHHVHGRLEQAEAGP